MTTPITLTKGNRSYTFTPKRNGVWVLDELTGAKYRVPRVKAERMVNALQGNGYE